jgi:hypothetical protein
MIVLGAFPALVSAGDMAFKPSVTLREDVTDNFYEQPTSKRTELTTRISPGATLKYSSPLWTWDISYAFDYRTYARNSKGSEYNHTASLKGNIAIIEKFLFLDLSDKYSRVTLDVSRTAATESSTFLNQTDQNITIISPYLLWRLRGDSSLRTGYRFTDTRYWGNGIEKQEQREFADLTHEVTSKFSLSAGYAFSRLESIPSQFNKNDLSGGFKYEYAEKSFISCQIGNSWQSFDTGLDIKYLFWNATITYDSPFGVAALETRSSTTEDPLAVSTRERTYSAKLDKGFSRGGIGLSAVYSEYVNTETNLLDRRRLGFTSLGRYELMQDLTVNLGATGERFSRKTAADYPYRFTGTAGLNYALNNDLTLGLTYTYVTNLYGLRIHDGAKDINRAIIDIMKAF